MPEPITKEAAQERSLIVRTWEAACTIEHPSAEELNFRIAVAKKLGATFGLRELRDRTIDGPVKLQVPTTSRPAR